MVQQLWQNQNWFWNFVSVLFWPNSIALLLVFCRDNMLIWYCMNPLFSFCGVGWGGVQSHFYAKPNYTWDFVVVELWLWQQPNNNSLSSPSILLTRFWTRDEVLLMNESLIAATNWGWLLIPGNLEGFLLQQRLFLAD